MIFHSHPLRGFARTALILGAVLFVRPLWFMLVWRNWQTHQI